MTWLLDIILDIVGRNITGLLIIGAAKAFILWAAYQLFLKVIGLKRYRDTLKIVNEQAREHEKLFGRKPSNEEYTFLWRAQGYRAAGFLLPLSMIVCLFSFLALGFWITFALWELVAQWPVSDSWPVDLSSQIVWLAAILFISNTAKEALQTTRTVKRLQQEAREKGREPSPHWIGWSIQGVITAITAALFFLAPSGLVFYWAAAIIVSAGQTIVYKSVIEQPTT